MQQVQDTLPIGSVVRDRYEVQDLLGKGGFGAVYLVKDRRVRGNLFALKEVIDPHKKERERFLFEGEVLKRLDNIALPRVYRAFENDASGRAYILMDYIEGTNLEIIRKKQPDKRFSLPQVIDMMEAVVGAIEYLHRQSPPIIHRDIKPANIILPSAGNETVLVDFGIAKEYDPESTTTAVRRYSPGYGAPEQYSTGTDSRTDIYGLAATIYTLLTGVVPAEALFRMTRMGSSGIDPIEPIDRLVPGFSPEAAAVINKAMSIGSKDRYPSVQAFWEALKEAAPKEVAAPIVLPADHRSGPVPVPPAPAFVPQTGDRITTGGPAGKIQSTSSNNGNRRKLILLLLLFALLGLGASALWGVLFLPKHAPTTSVTPQHTATPRAATPTPLPTATPRPKPTPVPTAKPTTAPQGGGLPAIAGTHNGTIHNTPANVDTWLKMNANQNNGSISGNLAMGPGLLGSGPFSGSVGQDKSIKFTDPVSGYATLLFIGKIAGDGSMSGSYCSLNSNNVCDNNAGGYGTWNLGPFSNGH
ncbi:MAG TPA: serine/threonine-protein kinase [Ktedonobacteraceae bacterium]|nr:serine/threonine-protein kinase [Ktedonobacteraceae bacterium]